MTGYFESLINDVPGNADELATLAIQWDAYGIACNDYADDVAHSARTAREWEGAARRQFNASLTRQRNRYINLGGDCTTASSALSVYAGAVRAGQSYIENLRYQASKLDEEVDKAPIGAVARVKLIPAANALISAAHVRIESVKQAADTCAQDLARIVHIEPVQIDNGRATAAGQMGQLSQNDIAQIQKDLDALKDGTFDWRGMTQGQIADCYFLAPMAALAQTPEGQRKLASMIQPHYDEHGNVDGTSFDSQPTPLTPTPHRRTRSSCTASTLTAQCRTRMDIRPVMSPMLASTPSWKPRGDRLTLGARTALTTIPQA